MSLLCDSILLIDSREAFPELSTGRSRVSHEALLTPNVACNKGNPPAIGVGLMKKLAHHFVIALTPEHYTSKTCVKCRGPCGAHPMLKTKDGKEIRGLRVCQHEGCGLLQNRDRTGASNIGLQFELLFKGEQPLRPMNEEELEFNRLATCVACCDQ